MSANTLNNRSIGQTILDTFFNDIHNALDGDFVGRGATGIPTSGQNLGTLALPWGSIYGTSIVLNGSALDTSRISSPANRIISGKKRATSNQPAFITPNGAAASCIIAGATTNLSLSIGGVTVAVTTDVTKSSLTTAPSSQNTATVNDTSAQAQIATRTWGEPGAIKKITMTSAGTNITTLIGKFAVFKIVHSAVTEYFVAYVESATVLSHCIRGYFYDSSLNPVNPVAISNGDTITLMKGGFVFMTNDATTVDVSYNFPVTASSAPTSPTTGDYWYDTVNQIWKRYDGASFQIVNRTLIGMVVMDSTNCVAARAFDFYSAASSESTLDLEIGTTTTNIQAKQLFQKANVAGSEINFGIYLPVWNGTNNYVTSADYFSAFAASSTYYLYLKDDGSTAISDIPPIFHAERYGYYHRHNPWRCIAIATTDGSSNWSYVGTLQKSTAVTRSRTVLTSTGTTTGYLFTITAGNATIGATFTNNAQTFTVLGTIAAGTQLFCSSTGAPAASGTLTKASGTGDATLTFSKAQAMATYTPPKNATALKVRGVGGGGGGGGNATGGTGGTGGITAFGVLMCIGNGGGPGGEGTSTANGATASVSSPAVGVATKGGNGLAGNQTASASGMCGASTPFGSGGGGTAGNNGDAAGANTGAGGGGGGGNSSSGQGGGAGGYFDALITPVDVSYVYCVGAGGTGGDAGGVNIGGSGVIVIDEELA